MAGMILRMAAPQLDDIPNGEIVQMVMHASVAKAITAFLALRNLRVDPFTIEEGDLPTFMVAPD